MKTTRRIIAPLVLVMLLFAACKTDDSTDIDPNALEDAASLVIEITSILRNQEISLRLVDDTNTDQTQYAAFYVNGTEISNSDFSASETGSYEIYARYNLAGTQTNTQTETVQVIVPKRKVLVEDFTGTWCGYCPRMTTAIQLLRAATDDVVAVSIHGNSAGGTVDPFTIPEGMFLKGYFEIPGYPWGLLNRNETWEFPHPTEDASQYAGLDTDISIAIDSQLIGSEMTIDVTVVSENTIENSRLVVFLLEDGLIYDQRSYYNEDPNSPWYDMGEYIKGFQHDDVLRVTLTDPLGDTLPTISALNMHSETFTFSIPSEYNSANLKIVAMVVNDDDSARNAQHAHVNENKAFE